MKHYLKKNPGKDVIKLIDLNSLSNWAKLSHKDLLKHDTLKNFIVSRERGKDVISAINRINYDDSQIFVLEDSAKLLDVYTMDINSTENYDKYSNCCFKNLAELTIQMANASIRETYQSIYNQYKKEIINNPEKKLAAIVAEVKKDNNPYQTK